MKQTEAYKLIKDNDHVRMPTSPEEAKCAEYLKNACEKLGLSAKIEPFIIPTFREKAAYLCVDGKEVPCCGRLGSPNASAKGPLYYLQSNSKVALRKCKGCVVLTERSIGLSFYRKLVDNGAVAIIGISGDNWEASRAIESRPIPFTVEDFETIPWVTVHFSSAFSMIKNRAKQAEVRTEQVPVDGISHNVIADIKGETDEQIVVCAHYDSTATSHGSYDNFSGCVALFYIAEQLKHASLRRGIRLLWCGAEEWGLRGSRAYCKMHENEKEKTVLNINLDMLGSYMGEFVAFSCADEKTAKAMDRFAARHRFPLSCRHAIRSSDSNSFVYAGIPAVSFARYAPAEEVQIHTPKDTAEAVSVRQLLIDSKFICQFTEWVANDDAFYKDLCISDNIREEVEKYFYKKP